MAWIRACEPTLLQRRDSMRVTLRADANAIPAAVWFESKIETPHKFARANVFVAPAIKYVSSPSFPLRRRARTARPESFNNIICDGFTFAERKQRGGAQCADEQNGGEEGIRTLDTALDRITV